jgi:hypothetical protein
MKWMDLHITDPERSDGECVGTVRGRGGVVVGRYLYRTATDTVEWDGDDSWRAHWTQADPIDPELVEATADDAIEG